MSRNEVKNNNENKRPGLDKKVFVFHQMINKLKKQILTELTSLKNDNNNKSDKNKELEEKISNITNEFNNQIDSLKSKVNDIEKENSELEEKLTQKNKEIEELKQKVNELIESTNEITLKFKIGGGNDNDDISIKVKGNSKIVEVLGLLYELCPNLNKMNIKGFCLEGKEDQKIDELKTVHENKLENGSLIVLMV